MKGDGKAKKKDEEGVEKVKEQRGVKVRTGDTTLTSAANPSVTMKASATSKEKELLSKVLEAYKNDQEEKKGKEEKFKNKSSHSESKQQQTIETTSVETKDASSAASKTNAYDPSGFRTINV